MFRLFLTIYFSISIYNLLLMLLCVCVCQAYSSVFVVLVFWCFLIYEFRFQFFHRELNAYAGKNEHSSPNTAMCKNVWEIIMISHWIYMLTISVFVIIFIGGRTVIQVKSAQKAREIKRSTDRLPALMSS